MEESEETPLASTILNLSKKNLTKVPKSDDAQTIRTLILDDNELQKIDNIDSYLKIEKLSLCKNQLLRMYGVSRLHYLKDLNLSYNGILTIEGLKDLTNLTFLNLEGNNIKTIEHLNTNSKLEILNLSENSIGSVSDISFLKNLKELYLHGNRITHLRQCDKYLTSSLEVLSLSKNSITDLNEICTLSHLFNLTRFSIVENPCVIMTGGNVVGFDCRPFVLNWIMSLKVIDGFVVNPIESLKAEWLYSQGRGRQFRVGEQQALARYLSSVCPLSGETLENEDERKLRLILSKAQQHQRQLQEEISGTDTNTSGSNSNSPSSSRRKGTNCSSRIQSPRFSRLSNNRLGSPDSSMSNSFNGISNTQYDAMTASIHNTSNMNENMKNDTMMTQSLDPTALSNNQKNILQQEAIVKTIEQSHQLNSGPLMAASKMMPVPESLMSPDCFPSTIITRGHHQMNSGIGIGHSNVMLGSTINNNKNNLKQNQSPSSNKGSPKISRQIKNRNGVEHTGSPILGPKKLNHHRTTTDNVMRYNKINNSNGSMSQMSSDEDSDHINVDKLKTIRNKAAQKSQQIQKDNLESAINVNKTTENSAILIQKMWRGFHTRNKTRHLVEQLQKIRTQEYITKLSHDMETTKAALENERKIQQLQMQAINALWKKVSQMEPTTTIIPVIPVNDPISLSTNTTHINYETTNSAEIVQNLAKTCTVLTNQVQQLQGSMRDVVNCMTLFCNISSQNQNKENATANISSQSSSGGMSDKKDSCSTQTEIVAVFTPQIENLPFPFVNKNSSSKQITNSSINSNIIITSKVSRPSTLPITSIDETNSPNKSISSNNTNNSEINLSSSIECDDAANDKSNESGSDRD